MRVFGAEVERSRAAAQGACPLRWPSAYRVTSASPAGELMQSNARLRAVGVCYGRRAMLTTILIVEDDADIRESLCDALAAEGFEAHAAENGADALAYLERKTPHVILLDLLMPVMSGTEFRLRQLADPLLAAIPVIVVSAYPVAAVHGPVLYLAKPVYLASLMAMIARALGDEN